MSGSHWGVARAGSIWATPRGPGSAVIASARSRALDVYSNRLGELTEDEDGTCADHGGTIRLGPVQIELLTAFRRLFAARLCRRNAECSMWRRPLC